MSQPVGTEAISFPVTVWYAADTGNIHLLIRSEPPQETVVTPNPDTPDGHAELYMSLLSRVMCAQASPHWEN